MPGWSPEIANEFIRLAAQQNKLLNQAQLQKLVYIAHGLCLAFEEEPLTGDRPEAWEFGPVYRRLADALVRYGMDPVTRTITNDEVYPGLPISDRNAAAWAELEDFEKDTILIVYENYGGLAAGQLSNFTRKQEAAPWREVFAGGKGLYREISHSLIREQFLRSKIDDYTT